jgi:hypothetical protein
MKTRGRLLWRVGVISTLTVFATATTVFGGSIDSGDPLAADTGTVSVSTDQYSGGPVVYTGIVDGINIVPADPDECAALTQAHPNLKKNKQGCNTTYAYGHNLASSSQGAGDLSPMAATWYTGSTWTQINGPLNVWGSKVTAGFRYNYSSVYTDWVDCSNHWGVGYSVTIDWCGTWNQGGGNGYGYLNFGDNITVSFLYKGFPVEVGHGQRLNIKPNGTWCCQQTW